jgi:hypothetical protein
MATLTKKVVVNGQEVVLSSMDGRSWFLKTESMYDFEKRLRQDPKNDEDIEDFEMDIVDDEPVRVHSS